ncbi:MAG: F0F1 ATP synthase subunit B [Firmicutes bacterium]|nr:F0F1 ATP synthase subunit B [Bacillota bacterium]
MLENFNIWSLIFQMVNLLIIFLLLKKAMYKPLLDVLQKREEFVENSLADAAATKQEAEEILAKYRRMMEGADQKAANIIAEANKKAEAIVKERTAEAELKYEQMINEAKEQIKREKEKALADIRDEIADLAVHAAGKLIGRVLTIADHERIVRECVEEVSQLN